MCGIVGFWDTAAQTTPDVAENILLKMRQKLTHRGPDGAGLWLCMEQGIALAHTRLAILDLSPQGVQPMHSQSGRYTITFNGEIYNHKQLKAKLDADIAPSWRGHSDTEIILAAFEAYGIERALKEFVGMFAIALWDNTDNALYLIRDRLGEKPLYYGWLGNTLIFGSELSALKQHYAWKQAISSHAVHLLMQYNCIKAPYTIYEDIYKVMPGHLLRINKQKEVKDITYWQLKEVVEKGGIVIDTTTAINTLEQHLQRAISWQMLADVPVGAFLSGGIDSSTVVALMQAQSKQPIKTFTIGFDNASYNEAEYAKQIAKHLGTTHTELYATENDMQSLVPQIANIYDEPFADSSQLPTYIVARLAKQHVTVSLSGDGGDELFGGYNRYIWTEQVWRYLRLCPKPLRKALAAIIHQVPTNAWDKITPSSTKINAPGEKIHKLARVCCANNLPELYQLLQTQWPVTPNFTNSHQELLNTDFTSNMMYADTMQYLPDDILVKVDRAAMAVSLETRMPFLDHHVLEYAWSLPMDLKIRNKQNKWIVRQILNRYVPNHLFERPKMGFGVPIHTWMRGSLREWAEDLLSKTMLNKHNILDKQAIDKKWQQHVTGTHDWQHHLWTVLMFQSWYEANHG